MQIGPLNIALVCEENPLFRLCHQIEYPDIDISSQAETEEVLMWANLLSKYEKLYDWSPQPKLRREPHLSADETLNDESKGWPELGDVGAGFRAYHQYFRCRDGKEQTVDSCWRSEQIVEYFLSHADALYRAKWQHCTKEERIALYQIANGCLANPANPNVLVQLTKRGYLYRDAGWFIVNQSFTRFVLSAEKERVVLAWLKEANVSIWQYLRIPILIAVIVLVTFIVFSTGQTLESVLAVLTAILGLIPLLLRNISLFRGGSS
jgi:hypothetical protein